MHDEVRRCETILSSSYIVGGGGKGWSIVLLRRGRGSSMEEGHRLASSEALLEGARLESTKGEQQTTTKCRDSAVECRNLP